LLEPTDAGEVQLKRETQVRIWALLGARPGDNDQVIALARALGLPFTVKRLHYNRLHLLGPRLLGASLAALTPGSRRDVSADAAPDVTISTGHRSVPVVRWLRRRAGTRSIHIGFPRVSPANFDLVVATPQYPIADHPNLLRIPIALTSAAVSYPDPNGTDRDVDLPYPRRLLIVGGPTLFWKLNRQAIARTLGELVDEARSSGGAVLVTSSPRTPVVVRRELASILRNAGVESLLAHPGDGCSYETLLTAADSIHVTADSVSMISDAVWTAKPVALIAVAPSAAGRLVFSIHDMLKPGTRVYPQDLRFFWRALQDMGVSDELAAPRSSTRAIVATVTSRAAALVAKRRAAVLTQ